MSNKNPLFKIIALCLILFSCQSEITKGRNIKLAISNDTEYSLEDFVIEESERKEELIFNPFTEKTYDFYLGNFNFKKYSDYVVEPTPNYGFEIRFKVHTSIFITDISTNTWVTTNTGPSITNSNVTTNILDYSVASALDIYFLEDPDKTFSEFQSIQLPTKEKVYLTIFKKGSKIISNKDRRDYSPIFDMKIKG